jgi:hypothetical protein
LSKKFYFFDYSSSVNCRQSSSTRIAFLSKSTTTATLAVVPTTDAPAIMGTVPPALILTSVTTARDFPTAAPPMDAAASSTTLRAQPPQAAPHVLVINDSIAPLEVLNNLQEQNVRTSLEQVFPH